MRLLNKINIIDRFFVLFCCFVACAVKAHGYKMLALRGQSVQTIVVTKCVSCALSADLNVAAAASAWLSGCVVVCVFVSVCVCACVCIFPSHAYIRQAL